MNRLVRRLRALVALLPLALACITVVPGCTAAQNAWWTDAGKRVGVQLGADLLRVVIDLLLGLGSDRDPGLVAQDLAQQYGPARTHDAIEAVFHELPQRGEGSGGCTRQPDGSQLCRRAGALPLAEAVRAKIVYLHAHPDVLGYRL